MTNPHRFHIILTATNVLFLSIFLNGLTIIFSIFPPQGYNDITLNFVAPPRPLPLAVLVVSKRDLVNPTLVSFRASSSDALGRNLSKAGYRARTSSTCDDFDVLVGVMGWLWRASVTGWKLSG